MEAPRTPPPMNFYSRAPEREPSSHEIVEARRALQLMSTTPPPTAADGGAQRSATRWRWKRGNTNHLIEVARACLSTPAWKRVLEHHVYYGYGSFVELHSESMPWYCTATLALFAHDDDLKKLLRARRTPLREKKPAPPPPDAKGIAAWVHTPRALLEGFDDGDDDDDDDGDATVVLRDVCVCGQSSALHDEQCILRIFDGAAPADADVEPELELAKPSVLAIILTADVEDLKHEVAQDGVPLSRSARLFDGAVSNIVRTLFDASQPLARIYKPPVAGAVMWVGSNGLSVLMQGMLHHHDDADEQWAILLDDPEIELVRLSGGLCKPEPTMHTFVLLPRLQLRMLKDTTPDDAIALLDDKHPLRQPDVPNPLVVHNARSPRAPLHVVVARRANIPQVPWVPSSTFDGLTWADATLTQTEWVDRADVAHVHARRPWLPPQP